MNGEVTVVFFKFDLTAYFFPRIFASISIQDHLIEVRLSILLTHLISSPFGLLVSPNRWAFDRDCWSQSMFFPSLELTSQCFFPLRLVFKIICLVWDSFFSILTTIIFRCFIFVQSDPNLSFGSDPGGIHKMLWTGAPLVWAAWEPDQATLEESLKSLTPGLFFLHNSGYPWGNCPVSPLGGGLANYSGIPKM